MTIPVNVRCEFADWLGSGHIATFGTDVTPGCEDFELMAICLKQLADHHFIGVSIQSITYEPHEK